MKKVLLLFTSIVLVVSLLVGCNFNTNFYDHTGNTEMKAIAQVESMMEALSAGNIEGAEALLHPQRKDTLTQLLQLIDFMNGRNVETMEQTSVTVNTSQTATGTARQESGTFRVTLDDTTVCYLSAVHYSDHEGEGFVSFQIVIGII